MKLIQPRNAALLLLVIVFAFGMRAVILSSESRLGVDGRERYEKLARNIQEGRGFSKATDSGYVPEDFDQPGYPYFLAAIYSLPAGGDRAVAMVQALLELFTLLLVVLICRRLRLPQRVQIGALSLGLICPFLPRFGNMIMTEVPATFLVTLACYFLVSAVTTANAKWWVLAGLAGGASLLVRADTIIAVGFMCVGAILLAALTNARSALSAALFLGLSLLVVMAPWMARNYRAFNEPRPLGGTAGQTHSAYVDWLNTWADDPVYLDRYWWNALNSTYPAEFPTRKLVGDEKQKADNALALARSQGTFAGKPMQVFAGLAENAKHDRPWQSYVAVPVRRFAMTWIRMPSSIESKPGRAVGICFLGGPPGPHLDWAIWCSQLAKPNRLYPPHDDIGPCGVTAFKFLSYRATVYAGSPARMFHFKYVRAVYDFRNSTQESEI
jgi:hypothetical protein